MRLFAKLFLLLSLCAALPLAFFGTAALWRARELRTELLRASARTGEVSADAGEQALFAESRRLHRRVVEARAAELADFFEQGRKLVALEADLAARALGSPPQAGGPPLRTTADMDALRADPARFKAIVGVEPYAVFHAAPGADSGSRDEAERLARLGDYYRFVKRETPWVRSTYLGSPKGYLVGYPGAAPFNPAYDPRNGDWYKKAVEKGRVTWTSIYQDKDGSPVITVAQPYFSGKTLLGVAAADILLEDLLDRLFDLRELPAADAALVNWVGGVRIAATAQDGGRFKWKAWGADDAPGVATHFGGALNPAFKAALKEPSGTLVVGGDLLSFARVHIRTRDGGKDWYYLVRTPLERVMGPAKEARGQLARLQRALGGAIDAQAKGLNLALLAVAALGLAAALGAAALGARGVARPLVGLAEAVRRIGKGDFDARVPPGGADEVGEVSRAVNEMASGLKEGAFVKSTFKRYVSASVVERILKDPEALKLGGEERELTVFFSDMSGFTQMAETMKPHDLVALINEYLSAMTDSIFLQEGTLDKYEGDAVMAFWGAPVRQDDHARRACWAALDNRSRLGELNKNWKERGLPNFDIRIGINTGNMVVGNVGSSARMEYTVLGDAVNTGSRLEQLNKTYGTHILISEATKEAAGGAVETREVDVIELRGKKKLIRVYELLGLPGQIPAKKLAGYRLYEHALAAFREGRWDEAEAGARSALAALGEDRASSFLLERLLARRT